MKKFKVGDKFKINKNKVVDAHLYSLFIITRIERDGYTLSYRHLSWSDKALLGVHWEPATLLLKYFTQVNSTKTVLPLP